MGILSLYVAMVFLCLIPGAVPMDPGPSNSKITQGNSKIPDAKWIEAKTYATKLCSEFAERFKEIKEPGRTQFAVLTLDEIDFQSLQTEITSEKLSNIWPNQFIEGKNWVASYIAKVGTVDHLERILLDQLPDLFDKYYEKNGKFPSDVYLYTYLIPCPQCTNDIKSEIKDIPETVQGVLNEEPSSKKKKIDLSNMVFWVIYTNTGNPNAKPADFGYTINTFKELSKNSINPNFQYMPLKETWTNRACVIE